MAKRNQFNEIPRPIRKVVVQTNGELAIVQDRHNRYWLVNRVNGRIYPDRFSLLENAKRKAASLSFIHDPDAASAKWKEKKR